MKEKLAQVPVMDWLKISGWIVGFTILIALQLQENKATTARSINNEASIREIREQLIGNSTNIATVSRSLAAVELSLRELVVKQQEHMVSAATYIEMIRDNEEEIKHLRELEERRHEND